MSKKYVDGKIEVAFRPKAESSEIEKILARYKHVKVFPNIDFDPKEEHEEQVLSRLYFLEVKKGKESDLVQKLTKKYNNLVEYVQRIPVRKSMNSKEEENE